MNLFDILGNFDSGNAAPISSTDDRFTAVPIGETATPMTTPDAAMPTAPGFPGGVPLPRPRPAGGPSATPPNLAQDGAPVLVGGEPPGQSDGALLAAVMGGLGGTNRVRSALAALGAGMAHVKNSPFKAQALANPLGAALEGGNKDEDRQYQLFTHRLAALDRALRARGLAVNPLRTPVRRAATVPTATASAPAQTGAAPPITNVPEITMAGEGTYDAPYQPKTLDDYAQIESGSYYQHPDGSVRLR